MDEEEREDRGSKNPWLDEHESIQKELMMIKKQIIDERSGEESGETKADEKEKVSVERNIESPPEQGSAEKEQDVSSEPEGRDVDEIARPEPTIKDLLGARKKMDKHPVKQTNEEEDDKSCLPKHPELSSYIARVIEHESKIKRRIFDKEKSHRERQETLNKKRREEIRERDGGVSQEENDFLPDSLGPPSDIENRNERKSEEAKNKPVEKSGSLPGQEEPSRKLQGSSSHRPVKPVKRKKVLKRVKKIIRKG